MMTDIATMVESVVLLTMVSMTGLYGVFSNTIMPSLQRVESGADIMVEVNRVILNPVFMAFFIISGAGALYLILFARGPLFYSGLIFLTGTTLPTLVKNVPLNNQLRDSGEKRAAVWHTYLEQWVFWNHVRTLAALCASLLIVSESIGS